MYLLLVAVVLAVQTAAPTSSIPPPAEQVGRGYFLFMQGLSLEAADDLPGAIDSFRQASQLLPGAADIHTALAGLYARQNQLVEARREAAAALAVAPDDREAHRLLGGIETALIETSSASGDVKLLSDAIDHLERSVAGGASDAPVELALSSLYLRAKDSGKAVERLKKLLGDQPEYPPALRLLVRAYEVGGQTREALATRLVLAKAEPDEVEMRVRRIERLERASRWADVVSEWAAVFQSDPGSAIYRTRYAGALANVGRLPEARTVLTEATRDTPRDSNAWYLLSLVEARSGNGPAAETAARRILDIDPTDARGFLGLARARQAGADYRGVVNVLAPRVDAPKPDDLTSGLYTEMASELSAAYNRIGQQKRAVQMLEGARKRLPDDEDLAFRLAATYEQARKYDQAERAFREIIRGNAKHAEALNYLGYMLAERSQKLPEAVELIKRALAEDADNPSFLDSLGWAYFKLGQFDNARSPLERAASAMPKASVIHEHLGDLYVQMKRYADAVAAFERALAGDRDGIDAQALSRKRDHVRSLAGKS